MTSLRTLGSSGLQVFPLALGGASQPTVAAPIASARTAEQVPALVAVAGLELTERELADLTEASV